MEINWNNKIIIFRKTFFIRTMQKWLLFTSLFGYVKYSGYFAAVDDNRSM